MPVCKELIMPKLIIDNIATEVAEGTNILEAAKAIGIFIPHFCWHPALGKAGSCRACAVKVLDGPMKGLQMSCMVPAQEGMVISTDDPEAVEMRRHVIEWLMINHPHDCPVCDEGGECLLQDCTIAGGHSQRRYDGKKRTHLNQNLGPYIEHEMNRCIQCYRCVRFYQEFAGGDDFGVMGSSSRVYFGRFEEGMLQSPFSGNLIDICPTGVFTDKTARYRARYWDYDMAPSICPECSLGCSIVPVARYRELLKIKAGRNDAVNGWFICDKGRFAEKIVNAYFRPRTPLIKGLEASWSEAVDAVVTRAGQFDKGSIAVVASSRLSLEAAQLLAPLAKAASASHLCFFVEEKGCQAAVRAVSDIPAENRASLEDVTKADCIVIYECDLLDEAPMMLLAVRQAWRGGAPVLLVGKGAPLGQTAAVSIEAVDIDFIEEAPIGIFEHPVVIFSTVRSSVAEIENILHAEAKFAPLFAGPNGFGVAALSRDHAGVSLEMALSSGKVRGIIAVETDVPLELRGKVPIIAALDWKKTQNVDDAEIVLPTTAWVEMDGSYVNNEGRTQEFKKVMGPGVPLAVTIESGHPPRVHSLDVPGGAPRAAGKVISQLIEQFRAGSHGH